MSLNLPDFAERKCLEIAFCGFLPADKADAAHANLAVLKKSLIARYTKSGKDVYVRLYLPFPWEKEAGDRVHIHFVLAAADWFRKSPPQTNSKPEEIFNLVEAFLGKEMDVRLTGIFRVPMGELPPFIRSTAVETTFNEVKLRMTAGTISVHGTPIQSISWELPNRGDLAEVTLEAKSCLKFEDTYLESGLELLEAAFRAFIVGERKDAKPK
jgi:hypothetical protein